MRNFLRFGFVLLFLVWGFDGVGQRKLPYPIIFIHGLSGNYQSWNEFAYYLKYSVGSELNIPLNGSSLNNLNFSLNDDGSNSTSNSYSDYRDLTYEPALGNCDGYIVDFNFGTKGNQAAIFKQGLAIRDAIKHVRNVTGADKVILMGHSMGGLAARDYLQNSTKWQSDGQHHVAKLVTVGTPHGGSNGSVGNMSSLIDELSEAVRDLRYSYSSGYSGAYLFGGYEYSSRIIGRVSNFDNVDVDCNGSTGNYVTGINQSPSNIPGDLSYSCIVGKGKSTYMGLYLFSSTTDGDQIVESNRADINNYFGVNASTFDIFSSYGYTIGNSLHTNLQKDFPIENVWALDEPSTFNHAYQIYANATSTNSGFFTKQSNGSTTDRDRYKVYLQKGITKIQVSGTDYSYPRIEFYNPYETYIGGVSTTNNSNSYTIANINSGNHFFDFIGESGSDWRAYNYNVYNQPSSALYANATSTCAGGLVRLDASESSFESYYWYRNGQYFTTTNTNYLNATTTGVGITTFTVKTLRWGITIDANNPVQVTTYAPPSPPILTAISLDGTSSTTGLNICNGETIALTTNCASGNTSSWFDGLNTYSNTLSLYYFNATTTTTYTAKCSNYFCNSTNSPPVRIVKEPNIQSTKNGNWQDPTMWTNNYVPLNCQTVTIQTGHTVNVPINDAKAKKIIINGNLNFQNVSPTVKGKVGLGI